MTQYMKLVLITAFFCSVSGCATGPSPTLSKYTEQQQKRCYTSLTFAEKEGAKRNTQMKLLIPGAGLFVGTSELLYQEYEKICKRKGVI